MSLLDLLFPKYCLGCGRGGKYFCQNCLSKVQVINKFDPISKTFSIFKYKGVIRKGIIKLKYNFAYDIAKELSDICALHLASSPLVSNAYLIPIPLHKSRERWRGFNQSELIGKLIAEKLGWGFNKDILIRPVGGQTQVGLRGFDRVRNIRGKYAVNSSVYRLVPSGCSFVVFDDVATTGSTLKEAIKVLEKACPEQGRRIMGLTIAR